MTLEEVLSIYGTKYRLSRQVGFAPTTPANWEKIGYIPAYAQTRIELHSKGKLKYKAEDARSNDSDHRGL